MKTIKQILTESLNAKKVIHVDFEDKNDFGWLEEVYYSDLDGIESIEGEYFKDRGDIYITMRGESPFTMQWNFRRREVYVSNIENVDWDEFLDLYENEENFVLYYFNQWKEI